MTQQSVLVYPIISGSSYCNGTQQSVLGRGDWVHIAMVRGIQNKCPGYGGIYISGSARQGGIPV